LHATGVEHALDNLDIQPLFDWTPADREVSRIFSGYVTQFVKTGDPNGPRLPDWQAARDQENGVLRQVIRSVTLTEAAREAPRHAFIHSALEERP
jgi:para-nitrobenzyl esterase